MTNDDDDDFDLDLFLPYLLNQAAEAAGRDFQAVYKARYGIGRSEWRVLFHLGQGGPLTAKEIASRAMMHKTKISRAVAALAARRFLTRERSETDRRCEHLHLTGAGKAAYRDLRREAARYDARLVSRFAPEESAQLRTMLTQLSGAG